MTKPDEDNSTTRDSAKPLKDINVDSLSLAPEGDWTLAQEPEESTKEKPAEPYLGEERRKGHRRQTPDRRADVRFEMNKEDRRKNPGRRKEDKRGGLWKNNNL